MTERVYVCPQCRESSSTPFTAAHVCTRDAQGLTSDLRFSHIQRKWLDETGRARCSRFDDEKMCAWADALHVPLNAILKAIERAQNTAITRGDTLYAFGYVEPHIPAQFHTANRRPPL